MPVTVSIVVPVYNAVATIADTLQRLGQVDLGPRDVWREIIVVDDASSDGTSEHLRHAAATEAFRVCFHPEHLGWGAALSTGLAMVTGEIVLVVDATLAYDPAECGRLLAPILNGDADVVYGSRYVATTRQVPRLSERLSDQILTAVSNSLTNVALTDVTSTFQAFRAEVVRGAILRADGPGVAGELAALFASRQCRIFEVPVTHRAQLAAAETPRWLDGLSHLTMMARCRFRSWGLGRVTPHQPFQVATMPTRSARLTRLVRPVDLLPMSPSSRPSIRAN